MRVEVAAISRLQPRAQPTKWRATIPPSAFETSISCPPWCLSDVSFRVVHKVLTNVRSVSARDRMIRTFTPVRAGTLMIYTPPYGEEAT